MTITAMLYPLAQLKECIPLESQIDDMMAAMTAPKAYQRSSSIGWEQWMQWSRRYYQKDEHRRPSSDLLRSDNIDPEIEAHMQIVQKHSIDSSAPWSAEAGSTTHLSRRSDEPWTEQTTTRLSGGNNADEQLIPTLQHSNHERLQGSSFSPNTSRTRDRSESRSSYDPDLSETLTSLNLTDSDIAVQEEILRQFQVFHEIAQSRRNRTARGSMQQDQRNREAVEPAGEMVEEPRTQRVIFTSSSHTGNRDDSTSASSIKNEIATHFPGYKIKIVPKGNVEEAYKKGEAMLFTCVGCKRALMTATKTTMIYCPACGTLARTNDLIPEAPKCR